MSKYQKVVISFATSTAEDQAFVIKFFPANTFGLVDIIESNPKWIEVGTQGRDGYYDSRSNSWKIKEGQQSVSHYLQVSLITDIYIEEVEIAEPVEAKDAE